MKKLKIYIASPYIAGNPNANVEKQLYAASLLVDAGCKPYVPLFNHFIQIRRNKFDDVWLNLELEWLVECDAVFRLQGYCERTEREIEFARSKNIPVLFSMNEVLDFISQHKKNHKK